MKRSDSDSLYVGQPTKRLCFDECSEDGVTITHIASPARNESEDNGPTVLQNTEDIITRLSQELLERIMLELNYGDISNVRRVCRRFRDVGNSTSIFRREFGRLKDCVDILLAVLEKQENVLTESPNNLIPLGRRGPLSEIPRNINLLRDLRRRYFSFDAEQQSILYASVSVHYIVSEVHSVLRTLKRWPFGFNCAHRACSYVADVVSQTQLNHALYNKCMHYISQHAEISMAAKSLTD
jgi:hypothetical protein